MSESDNKNASWLSYINLSNEYERRARFLPGLLSFFFLALPAAAFHENIDGWILILLGGTGVGAVLSIGISHLASAAGNRLQILLWPRWPYDSPTNQWLFPTNSQRSMQQKMLWYAAIKRVTGLEIKNSKTQEIQELEALINDAITAMRVKLRSFDKSGLLNAHNIDYGFARNFTGLRFLWFSFALIGCMASWIKSYLAKDILLLSMIEAAVLIGAFYLAFYLLPEYVRNKADRYAESFFGALEEIDKHTRHN